MFGFINQMTLSLFFSGTAGKHLSKISRRELFSLSEMAITKVEILFVYDVLMRHYVKFGPTYVSY